MAEGEGIPERRVMRATRGGVTRPVLRSESRRTVMTKAKRAEFLAALSESANVRHSCQVVGVQQTTVYKLRLRDAGFRDAWTAALDEGYARLETMTLDWAMNGVPKPVTLDGERTTERQVSERLAMTLLARHGAAVAERRARTAALVVSGDAPSAAEAFARFRASLEEIAERLAAAPCPACGILAGKGNDAVPA